MPRALLVVAFTAAFVLVAAASASAGTLDQSQTNTLNGSLAFGGQRIAAQTFTDGLSGVLDQVDLELRRDVNVPMATCNSGSGVTVQIRTLSGSAPGSSVLASVTVPPASVTADAFGFVSFALPSPPAVSPGTQQAIVVLAPDASCTGGGSPPFPYDLAGASGNPYSGGAEFLQIDSNSSWLQQGTFDADFRTYVGPPGGGTAGTTGQRAAALASCRKRAKKHDWSKKRLRKCKKKANLLPA